MCYVWTSKGEKFVEPDDPEPGDPLAFRRCPRCGRILSPKAVSSVSEEIPDTVVVSEEEFEEWNEDGTDSRTVAVPVEHVFLGGRRDAIKFDCAKCGVVCEEY